MKYSSLQRKYMGSDWNFVDDPKLPKTTRFESAEIKTIDYKFSCMQLHTSRSKPLQSQQSEASFAKPLPKLPNSSSMPSITQKSAKYRSPWYIPPKYWQKLSSISEANNNLIENRAKNFYYYLHKSQPNVNPLKKRDFKRNPIDLMYSETQNKLATLNTVNDYKK